MSLGNFIYAWMKQEADVTAIIGSGDDCKCFPKSVPQDKDYPAVTYQIISTTPDRELAAPTDYVVARVQINALSKGRGAGATADSLALAINGTASDVKLNGYSGTLGGIKVWKAYIIDGPHDGSEEWEPDASDDPIHRVVTDYEICYREP